MANFEHVCLKSKERIVLTLVLFANSPTDLKWNFQIRQVLKSLRAKYKHRHLHFVETNRQFRLAIGRQLASVLFTHESLLLFLDMNVVFDRDFLLRVRLNTIARKQVYFPIVLKYANKTTAPFWDSFNYGNMATYKMDFLDKIGGYDLSMVAYNDNSDVYDKYLRSETVVLRSIDPGIVVEYWTNINH